MTYNPLIQRELVILDTKLSMFGKFWACMEPVWKFERRIFYSGSEGAKLILAPLGMLKESGPQ